MYPMCDERDRAVPAEASSLSLAASVIRFNDGSVFDDEDQANNRSANASVRATARDWVVASR